MAKDGRFVFLCAGLIVLAGGFATSSQAQPDERDRAVAATLAVQTAMQQGRDHLVRGDTKAAVYVLEAQLCRINGNASYLALLRDAYRAHVKQLRLANQEAEAQVYLERLQILDPGAALDGVITRGASAGAPPPPTPEKTGGHPEPKVVRGSMPYEDPQARSTRSSKGQEARSLVSRAEEEYRNRHFREAWLLFEKAHEANPASLADSRERWAYCKLHRVFEQVKQPSSEAPAWPRLEREARLAMELAPRLEEYGKVVLAEIQKRRGSATEDTGIQAVRSSVPVRHFERGPDGWARAETANFRIFHNQAGEVAEQVARIAETTRAAMCRKWFGRIEPDWSPKCDLYLHPSHDAYVHATEAPLDSPGHSFFKFESGRLVIRRMDLDVQHRNMLDSVLPHETTHVVLAGQFADQPLPRWADEGIAVLAEPRERIERHYRSLAQCRENGQLFRLGQLLEMQKYPESARVGAFYGQSVSLVEYLSNQRGPQVFSQFLRDAQRHGYEPALRRHYSIQSFADLEQQWSSYAFRVPPGTTSLAAKSR